MLESLYGLPGKAKTLLDRLTANRASNLDNLDTAITSRAPSSTALSTAIWTNNRAEQLDKINNIAAGGQNRSFVFYTSSDTFIVPDGVTTIYVTVLGGGCNPASYFASGDVLYGGAGGGFSAAKLNTTPGTQYSVVVGGIGGNSSFGNTIFANGGRQAYNNGTGNNANSIGGDSSGGNVNYTGGNGGRNYYSSSSYFPTLTGGGGGSAASLYGNGSAGTLVTVATPEHIDKMDVYAFSNNNILYASAPYLKGGEAPTKNSTSKNKSLPEIFGYDFIMFYEQYIQPCINCGGSAVTRHGGPNGNTSVALPPSGFGSGGAIVLKNSYTFEPSSGSQGFVVVFW